MSVFIYEDESGVVLHVEYNPTVPISFETIRTVDSAYTPTGSDLTPMLDKVYMVVDGTGRFFLNHIVEEILRGSK
jgi:hypothetical protein